MYFLYRTRGRQRWKNIIEIKFCDDLPPIPQALTDYDYRLLRISTNSTGTHTFKKSFSICQRDRISRQNNQRGDSCMVWTFFRVHFDGYTIFIRKCYSSTQYDINQIVFMHNNASGTIRLGIDFFIIINCVWKSTVLEPLYIFFFFGTDKYYYYLLLLLLLLLSMYRWRSWSLRF